MKDGAGFGPQAASGERSGGLWPIVSGCAGGTGPQGSQAGGKAQRWEHRGAQPAWLETVLSSYPRTARFSIRSRSLAYFSPDCSQGQKYNKWIKYICRLFEGFTYSLPKNTHFRLFTARDGSPPWAILVNLWPQSRCLSPIFPYTSIFSIFLSYRIQLLAWFKKH